MPEGGQVDDGVLDGVLDVLGAAAGAAVLLDEPLDDSPEVLAVDEVDELEDALELEPPRLSVL